MNYFCLLILGWKYLKLKKIPYERRRKSVVHTLIMNLYYKYLLIWKRNSRQRTENKNPNVSFRQNEGDWVLSKISNAVSNGLKASEGVNVTNIEERIDGYVFYEHYLPYAFDLARGDVNKHEAIIWFTHLRQHSCSPLQIVRALNQSTLVVFQCKADADTLKQFGFRGRYTILNGGVDPKWKTIDLDESKNCKYDILISARYYERKNPTAYRKLIERNPDLNFLILGSGWNSFNIYKNVTIVNAPYSDYFAYYAQSKCLLSLSYVEGGPLCILEALACGLPIIMSRTGYFKEFCQVESVQLVDNFQINEELDIKNIIKNLEQHRRLKVEIDTWTKFGNKFAAEIQKVIL